LVAVVFTRDDITMPFTRAMVFGDLSGSRGWSRHGQDLEVGVGADTEEPNASTHPVAAMEKRCGVWGRRDSKEKIK
jgi:hypothetical protein